MLTWPQINDSAPESVFYSRVSFHKICDRSSFFWRKFHKNPPHTNKISFLGLSCYSTAMQTAEDESLLDTEPCSLAEVDRRFRGVMPPSSDEGSTCL
jgi:hypothetical protein